MAYTPESLIQELLTSLTVTVDAIERVELSAHPLYQVRTQDAKRLIGPQGEHLRALNLIVRRLAERVLTEEESKFILDVNGYHFDRIREVEQKARLLADRVRTFRSSAELTPMNAYERMLIHALFANDPEVTTLSEGEGKTRHIILKYRM